MQSWRVVSTFRSPIFPFPSPLACGAASPADLSAPSAAAAQPSFHWIHRPDFLSGGKVWVTSGSLILLVFLIRITLVIVVRPVIQVIHVVSFDCWSGFSPSPFLSPQLFLFNSAFC